MVYKCIIGNNLKNNQSKRRESDRRRNNFTLEWGMSDVSVGNGFRDSELNTVGLEDIVFGVPGINIRKGDSFPEFVKLRAVLLTNVNKKLDDYVSTLSSSESYDEGRALELHTYLKVNAPEYLEKQKGVDMDFLSSLNTKWAILSWKYLNATISGESKSKKKISELKAEFLELGSTLKKSIEGFRNVYGTVSEVEKYYSSIERAAKKFKIQF